MRYIPENNLAYPVLIKMDKGSCGSGFFLSSNQSFYLVTAKHVFLKPGSNELLCNKEFVITAYSQDSSIKAPMQIVVHWDLVKTNFKVHTTADVVIVKLGTIKTDHLTGEQKVFFSSGVNMTILPKGASIVWVDDKVFKKYEEVFISNEIFVLGYPVSIGQKGYEQIDINKPLIRHGIVAGKNENKRTIILDSPVYFGNSGGLVIEVDITTNGDRRFLPIGVVSEYVPFVEELYSLQHKEITSINRTNSGYSVAVPIDVILDLI